MPTVKKANTIATFNDLEPTGSKILTHSLYKQAVYLKRKRRNLEVGKDRYNESSENIGFMSCSLAQTKMMQVPMYVI